MRFNKEKPSVLVCLCWFPAQPSRGPKALFLQECSICNMQTQGFKNEQISRRLRYNFKERDNMYTSEEGIKLIKSFEGFRAAAYLCPAGYKTIGYGHVLAKDSAKNNVSREEAEELLLYDIDKAERSVERNIRVELTQGQFDALVSFTFNLGAAALQRSTLRQKVNRAEHEDVPRELMRWVYAGGMALAGLVKRREMEGVLYGLS